MDGMKPTVTEGGKMPLDLFGSYSKGQAQGMNLFAVGMKADEMARQKTSEKKLKENLQIIRDPNNPIGMLLDPDEAVQLAMYEDLGDKGVEPAMKLINAAIMRDKRSKEAGGMFPTRTQAPMEPVDQERVGLQKVYTQEGMEGVSKFATAQKALRGTDEGYTLSPGQIRFGPNNQPLAVGEEKEPTSDFGTFAAAGREQGWGNAQISEEWHKLKMKEAEASGKMRGLSFAYSRPAKVWDTEDKIPVYTTVGDMRETNQKTPGRFIPLESAVGFSAMNKSYANIRKQYDMTEQAVKQAEYLGTALLETSDNFKRSNYPTPNKLIVWASKEVRNPEVQKQVGKFKLALLAFSREYMRVVTGGARSVAELSVTAQQTADEVLSKFDTWDVLQAKLDQAFIEMNGVTQSYHSQMSEIEAELGRSGRLGETGGISLRGSAKPPPPPGAAGGGNIAPAGVKARLPDGRVVTSDGKGGWN